LREAARLVIQKETTEGADATGKDAADPVLEQRVDMIVTESRDALIGEVDLDAEGRDGAVQRSDEADTTLHTDTFMSIGSSTEGSPEHSTCGSSASASDSRKRAADESPDRRDDVTSRRKFPGRITRSAAGCRIYIPIAGKGDYPGSVLKDDGTFVQRITEGQEDEAVAEGEGGSS